ncbi:hypothetical protein SEMRO_1164_G248040.1 [Seminavis robusta]|uniref:Uncharacterized protein n=1 Tax=Seminavis robusta TaxID=568900 RepID=A0A9N8EIP0_9STRA|nr:hypothetical protein SEMRO_1164_G248040.1 [Seminavis robusta]|eukprot:Sro1164_g248040.1 n/a (702) ;mRNA; f:21971-24076
MTGLCKSCFNSLGDEGPIQICFQARCEGVANSADDEGGENDIEGVNNNYSNDNSNNCDNCNNYCDVDLASDRLDTENSQLDPAFLHTGEEHLAGDLELDLEKLEDAEEDHNAFEPCVPTTHVAAKSLDFDTTIGTMGTSVLLNNVGTMLVRRDSTMRASRKERHLIERVVSSGEIGTVPIVYLEGILFPSIFWCLPHSSEGGILGSMPTPLFCQHATRKQFNVASVIDHARTRVKTIGTTSSTDGRYLSFQFDSLANGALEGQDTRVVLSRGFEECLGPAGIKARNAEDDFITDQIDSRQNVHNLCASERDNPSTLFVTLTCNQREHFGVRNIKRYIDDGEALENYKLYRRKWFPQEKELSSNEEREVQHSLVEASMSLICRNWLEVKTILLRYILKSPEKPFGEVLKIFCRDEYQGDAGNLCHLHFLITLAAAYNTPEGKISIESMIRGHIEEIVGLDEVDSFIDEGILDNWEDFERMKEQGRKFLMHTCSARCKRRTGPGQNDLRCRVPDTRKISTDLTKFFQLNLHMNHSKAATNVMERLELCRPLSETGGIFGPNEDFLKAKRIFPVARHGEGLISPVIGRLFAATRSSMNVQICTSFGTSRYVVKYLIKIDENNYVAFHAKHSDDKTIKAEHVFLHNTKITSSAINEAKKLKQSRHENRPKGRALASTEMMQIILAYPQIYTNMEFVKVSTLPLGE